MLSSDAVEVVEIARAAGRKILARYGRPSLAVNDKTDGSPVTDADLEADRQIRAALTARWPFPVVSEETEPPDFTDRVEWIEWWLVDPLDGTRDFVAGTDEFCVCIARVFDGAPELGVIYAPVSGVTWAAERGRGCWRFERSTHEPTQVTCPRSREGPITAFKSRFHSMPEGEEWVRRAGATQLIELGSALKYPALGEGKADMFVSMGGAKLWDLAAGQIIAEETGARVLSLETKRPPRLDGESLMAGPFVVLGPRLDAAILDRVEYPPR